MALYNYGQTEDPGCELEVLLRAYTRATAKVMPIHAMPIQAITT